MPEKLTFDRRMGLISIRAWGEEAITDWVESKNEIIRLHQAHGARRVFVDARELAEAPSVLDILDFGDAWPESIKTAIVISRHTPEDVLFLDSVATHRHKPMRIFYDEDDALKWLYEPS